MTEMGHCPLCGNELTTVLREAKLNVGRRTIVVPDDAEFCTQCNETFYAPGELTRLQEKAAASVRSEEGLISPSDIRVIRESLSLTQAEFELLLGVGPKTVVRWERGTVFQSSATDTLLRAIRDVPGLAEYLGQLHRVALRELGRAPSRGYPATAAQAISAKMDAPALRAKLAASRRRKPARPSYKGTTAPIPGTPILPAVYQEGIG